MNKPDQGSRLLLLKLDATLTTAALSEFLATITLASQTLEADRRQGWLDALEAVYQFLEKLDLSDACRTRVPIVTLMQALLDLDQGTVDPGLAASRRKGGQQSGYDQAITRALASAAMDSLLKLGSKKPEAGVNVARALHRLGVPIGNSRNSSIKTAGKTVEKWRERLEEGSDQPRAVERYKSFKEIFRFPPDTSVDDIVAGLPRLLSEPLAGRIQKSD